MNISGVSGILVAGLFFWSSSAAIPQFAHAQESTAPQSAGPDSTGPESTGQDAAAPAETAAETQGAPDTGKPLNAQEMEILVARIALYPDELIALISGASLYPLQIVEASRFLDAYEKDSSLKPKESWDGSVVSLLNYPEIVRMMSDDLEWTQAFGNAIAYQQKDVLVAIQQLRDEAVANGVIKTDDKIEVVEESDNVVIKPANPEKVYIPQYEPEMLYVTDYVPVPVAYYPEPYPPYWYPSATFFAGFVTGAAWGAVVDWDEWGVWGGHWHGGDIDIDCNNCFNDVDFNGKINFNDVDWKNVDRDKISFDANSFNELDHNEFKNQVKADGDNAISDRAKDIKHHESLTGSGSASGSKDVRKSTLEGLKNPSAATPAETRGREGSRQTGADGNAGKPKPAARADNRPEKPSGLGKVERGKTAKVNSDRGRKAMGGGNRGGGHRQIDRPAGRRN